MRSMRSLLIAVHSRLVSVPTWCAMVGARGEKMVRSLPRSFWSLSCGCTLCTSTSSLTPGSAIAGLRAGSASPASSLSRKACTACGSVV